MEDEIIEALLDEYEDNEDMLGYCLSYLREICADTKKGINLAWRCTDELLDRNRCIFCGMPLQKQTIINHHDELEDNPIELETVWYCPDCDIERGAM